MGPKVAAARRFVTETGRDAAIGSPTDAMAVLRGEAGTTISHARGPTQLEASVEERRSRTIAGVET